MSHTCFFYYNIVLSYFITEKPVGPSISELDLEQVSSDDDSFNKSDKDEGEIDSEEDFKEVTISLYTPTPNNHFLYLSKVI